MIRNDSSNNRQSSRMWLSLCAATLFAGLMWSPAFPQEEQSREECNACCERSGLDDYYTDQCKLKCFRDHEHCRGKKHQPAPEAVTPPAPPPPRNEVSTPRPHVEAPPRPRRQRVAPAPQPPPPPPGFAYPEEVELSPGNEWQIADKILERNGIPRNHPNYTKAMQSIQGLLMSFVRANPQGGDLPRPNLNG